MGEREINREGREGEGIRKEISGQLCVYALE